MSDHLLPCPFCGTQPKLPDGDGTQYEIWCEDCGGAVASVQICDLMTIEERLSDSFKGCRYGEEFVERAKAEALAKWNTRAKPASEPKPAQRFTCIGKGGDYELVGSAFGAGTLKQYRCLMIYQNDSGTLFARDHDDFWERMQEIDPVPAGFEVVEPVDERAAFEAWHASRWPDGVPFEGRWESWQARAKLNGAPK